MTALPDHRAGGIRGLATRLGGIAPAAGTSIVRSRLFIKYVVLFVAVVSLALVANGVFDVYFSYQEQKASLVRIQREQAEAAAGKIGQFIGEIESQVGWTTQLPWSAGTLEQRRFDALRLLRQVPAITELAEIDSSGHEQLKVSRLAMEVVGSGTDVSKEPSFAEAVAHKVYYGPVYFRRESEPYMTLSLAGTRRDTGVSIAQVNLKLIWDVLSKIKFSGHGRAYVVDAAVTGAIISSLEGRDGVLDAVRWRQRGTGQEVRRAINHLFLFIGADPNTDWLRGSQIALDAKGFILTGAEAGAGRHMLETARSGVFAIGDVRAKSVKRVAAAVGEGAQVAAALHSYLASDGPNLAGYSVQDRAAE